MPATDPSGLSPDAVERALDGRGALSAVGRLIAAAAAPAHADELAGEAAAVAAFAAAGRHPGGGAAGPAAPATVWPEWSCAQKRPPSRVRQLRGRFCDRSQSR